MEGITDTDNVVDATQAITGYNPKSGGKASVLKSISALTKKKKARVDAGAETSPLKKRTDKQKSNADLALRSEDPGTRGSKWHNDPSNSALIGN